MIKRWLIKHKARIHPVTENQLETLAHLHNDAFFTGWSAEDFAELIRRKTTFSWYLSVNPTQANDLSIKQSGRQTIQAALLCSLVEDEAEILSLFTARKWRNKGAGSKLLNFGYHELVKRGARHWVLEVDAHNKAAHHLYRQFGFETAGHRPAYYQGPDKQQYPALIMRRPLP